MIRRQSFGMWERLLAVVMTLVLLLLTTNVIGEQNQWDCSGCGRSGNAGNYCGSCGHPAPWIETGISETDTDNSIKLVRKSQYSIGDYVTLGHYPQTEEGTDNTPIEWLVLDIDDGKALLLCRYGMDAKPLFSVPSQTIWKDSGLRAWLNNEFINMAFAESEKAAIAETTVINGKSEVYRGYVSNGGEDTLDKIFILSYDEVHEYLGVSVGGGHFIANAAPTRFAKKAGVSIARDLYNTPMATWWLRTPSYMSKKAVCVDEYGSITDESVDCTSIAVRPAMWISLEDAISADLMVVEESNIQPDKAMNATTVFGFDCSEEELCMKAQLLFDQTKNWTKDSVPQTIKDLALFPEQLLELYKKQDVLSLFRNYVYNNGYFDGGIDGQNFSAFVWRDLASTWWSEDLTLISLDNDNRGWRPDVSLCSGRCQISWSFDFYPNCISLIVSNNKQQRYWIDYDMETGNLVSIREYID